MPDPDDKATDQNPELKTDDQKTTVAGGSHQIKVNGETRQVTLEEALTLAQKGASADEKFREAAEREKAAAEKERAAAEGLHFAELMRNMSNPNYDPKDEDVRELASVMKVDPDELLEYVMGEKGDDPNVTEGAVAEFSPEQFSTMFQKEFGMAPGDAKEILAMSHQTHIDAARTQIRSESDKDVDKDEILGKMIVGEHKEEIGKVIKEMVAEDVFSRIRNEERYGPELRAAAIQKVRAHLTKLGLPGQPTQYPIALGLTPSGGLPAEVQSETPIKRVSASEDKDGSNFVARMTQKALQMMRNEGTR